MIRSDEIHDSIEFSSVFTDLPEYFTPVNQQKITRFIIRWAKYQDTYMCIEEALKYEHFTEEEIDGYALWRTVVYYSSNTPIITKLRRPIFQAVLERFTHYYRNLAGRPC